jgi:hypothetical protein
MYIYIYIYRYISSTYVIFDGTYLHVCIYIFVYIYIETYLYLYMNIGDLIPTRRWRLCSQDPVSNEIKYHIAILQGKYLHIYVFFVVSYLNIYVYVYVVKTLCRMILNIIFQFYKVNI